MYSKGNPLKTLLTLKQKHVSLLFPLMDDSLYSVSNETVNSLAETISDEGFSPDEYRFINQTVNDKFADVTYENIVKSGLSRRAKTSFANWLNTFGRSAVALSNQTNKEMQFALEAELALLFMPCRRSDIDDPAFDYFQTLLMGHYHLSASNATGPRRLGIRIFEKSAHVDVSGESEKPQQQRRKGLFR